MRNQQGTTLIEIMMAIGVIAVLVLGFMQFTTDLGRMTARDRILRALDMEVRILRRNLRQEMFCTSAFAGVAFNPGGGRQALPAATVTAFNMRFDNYDNVVPGPLAQLESLGLLQTMPLGGGVTYELHKGNLILSFQMAGDGFGGQEMAPRMIPMRLLINATTNEIVSCKADFGDVGTYCTLLGGTYDPTKVPACQLPVFMLSNCPAGEVVESIGPTGFNCVAPPNPPSGPPTGPSPPPLAVPYVVVTTEMCTPTFCECPPTHPRQIGGGPPSAGIVCQGYQATPPGYTLPQVNACLLAVGAGTNCVRLGTDVIRTGFGPCLPCP